VGSRSMRRPSPLNLAMVRGGSRRSNTVKTMQPPGATTSGAENSALEVGTEKSEGYSTNMTQAMGAVLTYRHELGMNYNFIRPDLIVGSCLQSPLDVDKLRKIGVKTIFCLQQDSDLEYPYQYFVAHNLLAYTILLICNNQYDTTSRAQIY